jgi:hypothetical protein
MIRKQKFKDERTSTDVKRKPINVILKEVRRKLNERK